jgi:hypothetical protein
MLDELRQFHEFVGQQLQSPNATATPELCLKEWRRRHPCDQELAESISDLRGTLNDMQQGDVGVNAREFLQELRETHGLVKQS